MIITDEVDKIKGKLVDIREDFHKHPELGFQEERTSRRIAEILREIGMDEVHTGIARTGVVGLLRGGQPGKTIALRADMDALPIQEANDVPYKSQNDGVMHACGHDAHITTVLGAAMVLTGMRDNLNGNVKFIFQPAEEIFGGGKQMVEAGVLESPPKVDAAIGIHVWPNLDVGTIGMRPGPAMASADKFEIIVKGPGGHGAAPHSTSDPIVASAQIINSLQTVVSRTVDPLQPAVLSVCKINGGSAFNIIPGEVRMEGTVRLLDDTIRAKMIGKMENIIKGIGDAMNVECKLNYSEVCLSLINDPGIVEIIEKAGGDVLGNENVLRIEPTMGGEDFTYFLKSVPGAMFSLGVRDKDAGIISPVHRATFDVPHRALAIGTAVLSQSVILFLNE